MPDRFREHRAALASRVGDRGIAVIPAPAEAFRNSDVNHPFRQDSNFFYLTGFEEPDAVCVLVPGHPDGEFHLFVNPRDREKEIWNGYRAGVEGALTRFGADAAHALSELDTVLPRLMLGREVLFYTLGTPAHDARMTRLLTKARSYSNRFGKPAPEAVRDVGTLLAEARLIKSDVEIESMRAAALLSAEGHREAMRFARPGLHEYQVQAAMEYVWREGGSPRNGYPSIVAAGPNACILHYVENDSLIDDGDLILIDAAAEIDLYSADITRTFPANGRFTKAQHAVYDVVLAAERAGIATSAPGRTLDDVHNASLEVLIDGMVDLGLLPPDLDHRGMHLYREFFMHGTSHWLGLDVHDAGAYRVEGRHRPLVAGMAFTVEPGIYVGPDRPTVEFVLLEHDLDARIERRILEGPAALEKEAAEREAADKFLHEIPEELLGIGVRIEDDIVITESGHENLTAHVPVATDDLEALCREPSWLAR